MYVYFHVQEAYLEAIFYPGRFASSAISRTLELYGANAVEEEQLPTVTTIKVEAEVNILYTLYTNLVSCTIHVCA